MAKTVTKPAPIAESMADIAQELGTGIIPFRQGDIIEVTVIGVSRHRILVNVSDLALGFIPQREFSTEPREIEPGSKLLAYVLLPENEDGYVILSLKRADRERLWRTIAEQAAADAIIPVKVTDANKGGLVINYGGVEGFLPISQLASHHFPRGGERDITSKLKDLVGQTLSVKILSFDERARKLIFSEKAAGSPEAQARLKSLNIGDRLEGTVTGVTDFGLFVDIGGLEGLVHISEVSWDRIDDLRKVYQIGAKASVEVIGIEENRVSLSMKRLEPDPWQGVMNKYQVGDRVTGVVSRITQFGAFVRLDEKLEGLVHISEVIDRERNPDQTVDSVLKVGESYPFLILSIDPVAHKIALSYRSAQ